MLCLYVNLITRTRGVSMRYWILGLSLALMVAPGIGWAAKSKSVSSAPVRSAPARSSGGVSHNFGSGTRTGAGGSSRSFGATSGSSRQFGSSQSSRSFGGSSSRSFGGSGTGRQFGSASSGGRQFGSASTGGRQFGGSSSASRGFGAAASGGGARHFGGSAASAGRGFHASNAPRLSRSGRSFTYGGHRYTRFAAARYRWPRGFRYRHWRIGERLPRAFWIDDYYIDDYADYDLAEPPDGYRWIRYGPDVVEIDTDTGQIAQSVDGVFDEDDGSAGAEGGDQEPQD